MHTQFLKILQRHSLRLLRSGIGGELLVHGTLHQTVRLSQTFAFFAHNGLLVEFGYSQSAGIMFCAGHRRQPQV